MAAHLCKRTEYTSWTELRKQITGQWNTLNNYICGACFKNFQTICTLHYHCMRHTKGGSYFFDHKSNTAYPRFDVTCRSSQYADDDLTNEKLKVLIGHGKPKNKKNRQCSNIANKTTHSEPKHIKINRKNSSVNDSLRSKVEIIEQTVEEPGNIDNKHDVQSDIITLDEIYGAWQNHKHDKNIEEANCFDADNGTQDKSHSVLEDHHTVNAGHNTEDKACDVVAGHHTIDKITDVFDNHHIKDEAHAVYPDHPSVKDKHDVNSDHQQTVDETHGNARFDHGSSKHEDHKYCKVILTGPEGKLKRKNTLLNHKEIKSKEIVPGQCTCYTDKLKNESRINLVKINEETLKVTLTANSEDVDQIAVNEVGKPKAQETKKIEQPVNTHEDTEKYEPGEEKSFVPLRSSRRRKLTEKIKESGYANILIDTRQEMSLNNDQDNPDISCKAEDSTSPQNAKKRKTSPMVNNSEKEFADDSVKQLADTSVEELADSSTKKLAEDSVKKLADDSVKTLEDDSIKELADIETESRSKNTNPLDFVTKIDQLKKKHLSTISPKREWSKAKKNIEKYISDLDEKSITKPKIYSIDNISNDIQCAGITERNFDQQNKSIVKETAENHDITLGQITEESKEREDDFFQIHKRNDFICQVCGKMGTIGFVNHHNKLHSESSGQTYDCEMCGKSFKTMTKKADHMRLHGIKRYKCDHCPAAYHRKANLQTHLYKHTGVKPHMCDNCGERYSDFSALRRHVVRCRGDTKNFSCDICGKKFYQKIHKERHRKRHFAPELLCSQCPHMCHTQTDLKKHELTHTGEKRFFCSLCYIGCSQWHAYYRHMQNTHNIGKIQAKELVIRNTNTLNVKSKHENESYSVNINGQSLNAVATKKNRRKTVLSLTGDPPDLVSAEQNEAEVQTDLLMKSNESIRNSETDTVTVNPAEIEYLTNQCVVTDKTEETHNVADTIAIYESGEGNDAIVIQANDNPSSYFVLNDFLSDRNIVMNSDGTSCNVIDYSAGHV